MIRVFAAGSLRLATLGGSAPGGKAFADFLLSEEGQDVLESHGFSRPG